MNNEYNAQQQLQLAVAKHQQGDLKGAEEAYRELIQKAPGDVNAYNYLSSLLAQTGRINVAFALLEKAMEIAPNNITTLATHTQVCTAIGNGERALLSAQKLIAFQADSAEPYFHEANAFRVLSKQTEALKSLDKSLDLNPNFIQALVSKGELLVIKGNHAEGQTFYQKAINIAPDFLPAIIGLGMAYHTQGKSAEAESQYLKAYQIAPQDPQVLKLMGNINRDMGNNAEAIKYYNKALEQDPENAIAKENLSRLSSFNISSWHLEMLADSVRNSAYHKAIKETVNQGDLVIDIGAGSGLLSLMAAKAGAEKVIAFEMVDDLAQVARKVVADNDFNGKIEILNKKSSTAILGQDISRKADVLISEIMDSGLLGEGVLPSHRHALANLCVDEVKVVPQAATILAKVVEIPSHAKVNPVGQIEGFDLSAFEKFRDKNPISRLLLRNTPHTSLSETLEIETIDFKNLPPVYSPDAPFRKRMKLKVEHEGVAHAMAFWFNLHLNGNISASSGPDGEMFHWGQAVCFFSNPKALKIGDFIEVEYFQTETRLWFEACD